MSTIPTLTATELVQQLAAERSQRLQAEAMLGAAQAQIAALTERLTSIDTRVARQHAQLLTLVCRLPMGLVLVDPNDEIQFVSEHFWKMFNLPPVRSSADGTTVIRHADVVIEQAFLEPAAFLARVQAIHAAGESVFREEFIMADGRVLELDYMVLDAVGAGRLICYRNVTGRHKRETLLRLLSFLPEQNPNPILRLDATGHVVYANPAAQPLLADLTAEVDGALPRRLRELVSTALDNPAGQEQELAVGNQYYFFQVVGVPGQQFATLYLTNITTRQQARQELAKQRTFFEEVLEQLSTSVAVFDEQHRYLFVNSAIEPDPAIRAWMLGKTSDEACAYRQQPALARERAAMFALALRGPHEVLWEETRHRPPGIRHLLMRYRAMPGPDGRPRVISSGTDITERKQAEEAVVRQREFYEAILNLLPVDVAIFDADHRFVFVNPSSISDAAVRQQIIGMSSAEYFAWRQPPQHNELAEQREQYFTLAVRTRTDVSWEEMRTDRKGRPQLMLRNLRPVYAADGGLQMVVGSGIDITSRYHAEKLQQHVQEMLREQQMFIRQVVDALPSVVYLVEADGSIAFANKAFTSGIMLGGHLSAGEKSPVVQEEVRRMQALNALVLTTGQEQSQEQTFTLISGEVRHFQVLKKPLPQANGQIGILTISTDITAMKQARQELERREKKYFDLVYYSQALICTHDLHGVLLSANPAIERLMNLSANTLVGHSIAEALLPRHHPALHAYLEGIRQRQSDDGLVKVITDKGEPRYLHYFSYQVAEEGQPPYVVASGYDVTEGIMARRELERAKHQAEENTLAKESFLARMSHEIRTPLNGVLGMANLLQKTDLIDSQREYLNTMQQAGRHLLSLLNDVLDMAKINADQLELNLLPFDLGVALQGAGQAVAALAEQKNLLLVVEPLPATTPRLMGDAYRLHQVLLNLLSNALKFTEHGEVRLGTELLENTADELVVRFWVSDTGIGIAPAAQAHIFEAFTQASAETSLRFGGTGLGLAISQQLVAQMGGTLTLQSEVGRGTTFSFQLTLPHAPEMLLPGPDAPAEVLSYEGLRGLRVLLAEDNLVNQWIARVVLEHWGVEVQPVGNGLDALAWLQGEAFDAAILDIRMPGLSGVEVTTAIRAHADPRRAQLPIIALTANAFDADRLAYLAAGMNACLTKPYNEADLCELLLRLTK